MREALGDWLRRTPGVNGVNTSLTAGDLLQFPDRTRKL